MNEPLDTATEFEQHKLLWERFRGGNEASFGILAEKFYRPLYNYSIKLVRDDEFVADCIQELYLELWERRGFLGKTENVKSYLLKAIRNKIIKESIRLRRFREPEDLDFITDKETSVELEIVAGEAERQTINHLKKLLGELSRRQQEIIYLRFYQNLEFAEISEVMGLTRQSVANLLHRAIRDIRNNWIISVLSCIAAGWWSVVY